MKASKIGLCHEFLSKRGDRLCAAMTSAYILNAVVVGDVAAQVRQIGAVDEIIVTARRRAETLQQAPISIAAFPGQDLERRGAAALADLPLANLSIREGGSTSGAGFTPVMSIRGVGQTDFTINTDPGVGVYLDGVYLGRTVGSVLDLLDVERVEVLRGPQGTLFGRNTIGGAVRIISRAPKVADGFTSRISVAAGEGDYRQFRVAAGGPLGDRVALRLSAVARQRGGYVDALQYDDLKLGQENLRAALAQQAFIVPEQELGTLEVSRRGGFAAQVVS
ncbi:MAG TPA: TonB-dependent receptor, partial [Caulobacter sp.]|nr:TonB-dependent receptor [Caulobacter sp.]